MFIFLLWFVVHTASVLVVNLLQFCDHNSQNEIVLYPLSSQLPIFPWECQRGRRRRKGESLKLDLEWRWVDSNRETKSQNIPIITMRSPLIPSAVSWHSSIHSFSICSFSSYSPPSLLRVDSTGWLSVDRQKRHNDSILQNVLYVFIPAA